MSGESATEYESARSLRHGCWRQACPPTMDFRPSRQRLKRPSKTRTRKASGPGWHSQANRRLHGYALHPEPTAGPGADWRYVEHYGCIPGDRLSEITFRPILALPKALCAGHREDHELKD